MAMGGIWLDAPESRIRVGGVKNDEWQIQTAKNQFSAVIAQAQNRGVQTITKHGKPVAVVVAMEDFENMERKKPNAKGGETFVDLLKRCPVPEFFEIIEKTRPRDVARDLDLG